jgi:hypothetical protein
MTTKQVPRDFPEVQGAIYEVALSLDAFLMNGIQYGVLQRALFPEFLQKTAANLLRDLASLEEQAPHASGASQDKIAELLASLRARCQQLVDLVAGLSSFRTLSLDQVRSTVSQVSLLRGECVQRIQELETCWGIPQPFYQSRPSRSTVAVNDFLANLERAFTEEWAAANPVS